MDDAAPYVESARRLSREAFLAEHGGLFLLKRPLTRAVPSPEVNSRQRFDTARFSLDSMRMIQASTEKRARLLGDWAERWLVAPVAKRVETFPDRVSVGRTNYCDIVLRLGFVSKLHAHIFIDGDGAAAIVDRSSNGTAIDGRILRTGVRTRLRLGSRISFGALDVELVDGGDLHDALVDL
jgi:hypothetical protein